MQFAGRTHVPSAFMTMPSGQKHLNISVSSSAGLGSSQVGPGDLLNLAVWPAGQSVGDGESVCRTLDTCIINC